MSMNLTPNNRRTPRKDHVAHFPLPSDILAERDATVTMPDGIRISVNIYRPQTSARVPVVLACTRYGKDATPAQYLPIDTQLRQAVGLGYGDVVVSDATPFEAPDPAFWVPQAYAVVHVDARGTGKSEGVKGDGYSAQHMSDFARVVEWAADQPWSSGAVGLTGVSYLAIVQYAIAALKPRGLKAIIPWEGQADRYRDVAFHGGIPETGFTPWIAAGGRGTPGSDEEPRFGARNSPLISQLSLLKANLSAIELPALICASWSDQGLHTRGSIAAFNEIRSEHKFLYTHGRGKWTVFHGSQANEYQLAFFERFLKGREDAMSDLPRVRLEVRRTLTEYEVRAEDAFPPRTAQITNLWLDALTRTIECAAPALDSTASYASQQPQFVHFTFEVENDIELSGPMALTLWASCDAGDDIDLFVGIRKFDRTGHEVHFEARENDALGIVANGWLRATHRKLDPHLSNPLQPVHTHDEYLPVRPHETYELNIEILPSSTLFEAGSKLVLTIGGRDVWSNRMCQHRELRNEGRHTLYTGPSHPSRLTVPMIRG